MTYSKIQEERDEMQKEWLSKKILELKDLKNSQPISVVKMRKCVLKRKSGMGLDHHSLNPFPMHLISHRSRSQDDAIELFSYQSALPFKKREPVASEFTRAATPTTGPEHPVLEGKAASTHFRR